MARMIRFLVMGLAVFGLVACGGDDDGDGKRDASYCETWCGWTYDCSPEQPATSRELYVLGCLVGCELNVEESCPAFNEAACKTCLEESVDTQCIPLSASCLECDCLLPIL